MREHKKVPIICRHTLQNFPFIENNIDALTDYGLESGIIGTVNKVVESQNKLVEDTDNAIDYMKNSIEETTTKVIVNLFEEHRITFFIRYDATDESLNLTFDITGA